MQRDMTPNSRCSKKLGLCAFQEALPIAEPHFSGLGSYHMVGVQCLPNLHFSWVVRDYQECCSMCCRWFVSAPLVQGNGHMGSKLVRIFRIGSMGSADRCLLIMPGCHFK